MPSSAAFLFIHKTGSCLTYFFILFFAWYRLKLFVTDIGARFHTLIASLTQDPCTTFDLPICKGLTFVSALVGWQLAVQFLEGSPSCWVPSKSQAAWFWVSSIQIPFVFTFSCWQLPPTHGMFLYILSIKLVQGEVYPLIHKIANLLKLSWQ